MSQRLDYVFIQKPRLDTKESDGTIADLAASNAHHTAECISL
jgi:hypothetical protein